MTNEDEKEELADPSVSTRFKVGNSAWRARSSHGRKPIFADSEKLEAGCLEYFEWVEENPLYAVELVKFQGDATQAPVPKMRAMTILGLCNFLDIDARTWANYKEKPDFFSISTWAEGVIRQQKIEGAAADLLNNAFIAREMGLADKQEVKTAGSVKIVRRSYSEKHARD